MCQFKSTLELFEPAVKATRINIKKYEGFVAMPDDLKAATLFVNFYNQITLAWSKCKRPQIEDELAVSTVMQYLIKAVPLILWQRDRYTERYIYTTAFNCLWCLTRPENLKHWYYDVMTNSLYVPKDNEIMGYDTDGADIDNFRYFEPTYRERAIESYEEVGAVQQSAIFWKWVRKTFDKVTIKAIETIVKDSKWDKRLSAKQQQAFNKAKPVIIQFIIENCPEMLTDHTVAIEEMERKEARQIIADKTELLTKVYRTKHPLPLHDEQADERG